MLSLTDHLADFQLAQKCLENDSAAIAILHTRHRGPIRRYLMHRGAKDWEAEETVDLLWGDLVIPRKTGRTPLSRYDGSSQLQTWLNVVALNLWLSRKRISGRHAHEQIDGRHDNVEEDALAGFSTENGADIPLLLLIRDAIDHAFLHCPAEYFVLLQLEHFEQLTRDELARMFQCSKPKLSRLITSARKVIQKTTLGFIKKRDPWLELRWKDFLDLCRTATPACFGWRED